jgi:hypothetical protein
MSRFTKLLPAAFAVALGVGSISAAEAAPLTAASSASVANIALNVDGLNLDLGNLVGASGSGSSAYLKQTALPGFSKTLGVPAAASLMLTTGGVVSRAGATVPNAGRLMSGATSSVGTLSLDIKTALGSLLSIHVGAIASHAGFTRTTAGLAVPGGSTDITKLVISGALLGIPEKTFTGSPKPNQILFQTPDKLVTIYLNRQTITSAAGKPTSITTDAIAVEIGGEAVGQLALSGDVAIGTSMAN